MVIVLLCLLKSPLQAYNCAVNPVDKPCSSVAMSCSADLLDEMVLRGGQKSLPIAGRIEWTHSPRF